MQVTHLDTMWVEDSAHQTLTMTLGQIRAVPGTTWEPGGTVPVRPGKEGHNSLHHARHPKVFLYHKYLLALYQGSSIFSFTITTLK